MSSELDQAVAAMGEQAQFGSVRYTLPASFFHVTVLVEDTNIYSDLDQDGNERLTADGAVKKASPFAQLGFTVKSGPYAGIETGTRLYLSPGRSGNYMGFLHNASKVLTGRPVNTRALESFGFTFSNPSDADLVKEEMAAHFFEMTEKDRLDFMIQYLNIQQWDGKECVLKTDVELNKWKDKDDNERESYRNRAIGFFTLKDPKYGARYVKSLETMHKAAFNEQFSSDEN